MADFFKSIKDLLINSTEMFGINYMFCSKKILFSNYIWKSKFLNLIYLSIYIAYILKIFNQKIKIMIDFKNFILNYKCISIKYTLFHKI